MIAITSLGLWRVGSGYRAKKKKNGGDTNILAGAETSWLAWNHTGGLDPSAQNPESGTQNTGERHPRKSPTCHRPEVPPHPAGSVFCTYTTLDPVAWTRLWGCGDVVHSGSVRRYGIGHVNLRYCLMFASTRRRPSVMWTLTPKSRSLLYLWDGSLEY